MYATLRLTFTNLSPGHLQTTVTKVTRADNSGEPKKLDHARWLVNDDPEPFDAVIVNIGTCGDPKMVHIDGMPDENGTSNDDDEADGEREAKKESKKGETFAGKIVHSSGLDELDMEGKHVVVVGSGASAVEAIELAIEKGAKSTTILARYECYQTLTIGYLLIGTNAMHSEMIRCVII